MAISLFRPHVGEKDEMQETEFHSDNIKHVINWFKCKKLNTGHPSRADASASVRAVRISDSFSYAPASWNDNTHIFNDNI